MIRKLLFVPLAAMAILFLGNCMKQVSMNSMRPAEITLPSHVNKVILVNRTKFDMKGVNILEGLLTGELPGADQSAAEAALSTFQNTLLQSPRYEVVRYPELLVGNSITAAFPKALDWNMLERIASDTKADAVIAVEMFDTDFIVTNGSKKVKKEISDNGTKREVEVTQFTAEGIGNVKIGFRIYDLKSRSIIDEQLFSKTNTWNASGDSPTQAAQALISKTEAARYVSQRAANDFAYKIAPMPVRITREFYVKAKDVQAMTLASRKAEVNDWTGAIKVWKQALEKTPSTKSSGKLAYNIAVGYEVIGEMQLAKEWAQKAYVNYGNKKGQFYVNVLERRMLDEERVMQQMQ